MKTFAVLILFVSVVTCVIYECSFGLKTWRSVGDVYSCAVTEVLAGPKEDLEHV